MLIELQLIGTLGRFINITIIRYSRDESLIAPKKKI